jgi:hypothetical protein
MIELVDPIIKKISEIKSKKELAKFIFILIKNKVDSQRIRTAINKFLHL